MNGQQIKRVRGAMELNPEPRTLNPRRYVGLLVACLLLTGCGDRIDTLYGQRKGPGADKSVNGTGVLGEMFQREGHKVFSWRKLSPRLRDRADCIVWFPNDFEPPTFETRRWLEDWLCAEPDRTVIYVGRDFDAASWYWNHVKPNVPADQQTEFQSRRTCGHGRIQHGSGEPSQVGRLRLVYRRVATQASRRPDARGRRRLASRDRSDPARYRTPRPAASVRRRRNPARIGRRHARQPRNGRREPVDRRRQRLVFAESPAGEPRAPQAGRKTDRPDRPGTPGQTVVFLESGMPAGPPIERRRTPPTGMPSGLPRYSTSGRPTGYLLAPGHRRE